MKIIAGEYKNSWGRFGIPRTEWELRKQGTGGGGIPQDLLQKGVQGLIRDELISVVTFKTPTLNSSCICLTHPHVFKLVC